MEELEEALDIPGSLPHLIRQGGWGAWGGVGGAGWGEGGASPGWAESSMPSCPRPCQGFSTSLVFGPHPQLPSGITLAPKETLRS